MLNYRLTIGPSQTDLMDGFCEEAKRCRQSKLSRREFMNRSLAVAGAGASFAIGGTKSSGRVIGANDTIHLAVAGLNGRGGSHVGEFVKIPGVEITYLVDPDTRTY